MWSKFRAASASAPKIPSTPSCPPARSKSTPTRSNYSTRCASPCPFRSPPPTLRPCAKICACATATSTCGGSAWPTTCVCATRSPKPFADFSKTRKVFSRLRRRFSPARPPRARATTWCPPGSTPANFTPCPSRPSSSSNYSWCRGSIATTRSPAASATKTCGPIASPSLPSWIWK